MTNTGTGPDTGTPDDGATGDGAAHDGPAMDVANDTSGGDTTPTDVHADTAPTDTAAHDVPPTDTGTHDTGPMDTGSMDTGPTDTGPTDTGPSDTGRTDTGPVDSGTTCASPCPTGFACGPHGYCVTAHGVPAFGHVYLIVMENHSLSSIMGSADAPYVNMLMNTYAYATAYVTRASSPIHPSCPNYIALTSGDTHGIGCDCVPQGAGFATQAACFGSGTPANCPQAVTGHLGDVLDGASIPWRAYGEDMGTPCNVADSGNYVVRHIPFLYYNNVRTDATRCNQRVRDFAVDFSADLTAGTYRFSMISPNLCDDMHGNGFGGFGDSCTPNDTGAGDNFLMAQVPNILATSGFGTSGTDVLFIVWDEEDSSTGGAPIPLIVVSPLVRAHGTTGAAYSHYSLLNTILEGLGLGTMRIGVSEATSAPVINDVWR